MNRKFLLILSVFLLAGILNAQTLRQADTMTFKGIYEKHIPDNQKINYPYLREADAVWAKFIYRTIDLREKMNQQLYYPVGTIADGRKSFMRIILEEVKAGRLNVYDVNSLTADSLVAPTTYSDVEKNMDGGLVKKPRKNIITQQVDTIEVFVDPQITNVKQLQLYEEWFFDKKLSTLSVRIIAIRPIYFYFDQATNTSRKKGLLWVRFDDIRDVMSKKEIFSTFNDAQRISFDDLFMQRRFDSYINAESNVFDDRLISDYAVGRDAMFEAERIKRDMANWEHDLWEY